MILGKLCMRYTRACDVRRLAHIYVSYESLLGILGILRAVGGRLISWMPLGLFNVIL